MQQVLVVEVESNDLEMFVHEMATKLLFGRQSLRPLVEKDITLDDGSIVSILGKRDFTLHIMYVHNESMF